MCKARNSVYFSVSESVKCQVFAVNFLRSIVCVKGSRVLISYKNVLQRNNSFKGSHQCKWEGGQEGGKCYVLVWDHRDGFCINF
jgi:hypothetical protein